MMYAADATDRTTARSVELLAPAGGWEQLEYAIRFGADAVYLATDRFGMRARADNFPLEEIPQVVAYAHERNVAVHVTCNTVLHDPDFADLPRYLEAIDAAGVDAVIVGDVGALRLAREHAPHVAIHVSTQASVSNVPAALTFYELGAKRIVCARELSLDAIAAMRAALPADLELEAFVHGSMCMAVSGRCLISDYLTGRSALEGNCTQPCRWGYALAEEKRPGEFFPVEEDGNATFIMNAQDMNMLAHLDALRDAGISSFKIEGRNKKAFYVATVVNAYRQVLDGADPAQFAPELETVSHRPYGTGFYFGPAHQTYTSDAYIRPYDWALEVVSCEVAADMPATGGLAADMPDAMQGAATGSASHAANGTTAAGQFVVTGICRNRFWNGSTLEVLAPRCPVRSLRVENLRYVGEAEGRSNFKPNAEAVPGPVDVANRTMELYSFASPFAVSPHDIMRIARS